jgi:predicted Zn-dependent protease with MMP-like domain
MSKAGRGTTMARPAANKSEGRKVEKDRFEELVAKCLDELPEEFQEKLENVDVVVEDRPAPNQVAKMRRGMELLGLYEGVPHTRRTRGYNLALPDKITIFQRPIERRCHGEKEIAAEVQRVLCHEIAHHFGFDEESLRRIEGGEPRRKGR